jgi:hypothetical protein
MMAKKTLMGLLASGVLLLACRADDGKGTGTGTDSDGGGDDGSDDGGDDGDDGDSGSDAGGTGTGDGGTSTGDGSTSGTGTGDTDTGATGTGDGTSNYPDCRDGPGGPSCDGDANCVQDQVDDHDGVQGRVCASQCTEVGDCPAAGGGAAVPLCADLSPDGSAELFCVLDCEGPDGVDGTPVDCPAGMVCGAYQVHEPPGGGNPLEWRRICIWEG